MRLLFIVLTLSFVLSSPAQSKIDVLHYKYSIELNDSNDSIKGTATITYLVNTDILNISFDLSKVNSSAKGMMVTSATFPSRNGLPPLTEQADDKLTLTPMYGFKKGDTEQVIITYKGIPADGLIISKNKYGHRTFFSDNWPNRAHNWIPCVDDPADKASVEFIVTAPSHYQVVSNGVQIEETNLPDNKKLTHWKEDVPLPTKIMVIGVADFAVDTAGMAPDSIPITSWVFPENKEEGFYDYALAKDILSFLIDYIGPYPYKKLANVQSKTIFGGMENAGAIFYHENSVDGKRTEEGLFAHEIVHQWFGDMATEKDFAHIWLSEGFATYLTHLYYESKYGADVFTTRIQEDRLQILDFIKSSDRPVVDSVSSYMSLLNTNSYQRGSWVLHMLRRQLGDSLFHKGIGEYYETYKGKNAITEDLQAVFEKVSGKKLDTFFRQWLHTADIPKLDISWKYNAKEKKVTIILNQLQKSGPFSFPLDILIQGRQALPLISTRQVNKTTETFSFPVKGNPVTVKIDPFISLLYYGTVTEAK
jgi:aminopeptidase N